METAPSELVAALQRRRAIRAEAAPGEHAHRHRVVERPRGGGSDGAARLATDLREDADGIHVGVLALGRPHADGGVALEQLDVVEALLRRVEEILELQILVEVDEVLPLRMINDRIGMARAPAVADRRLTGGRGAAREPVERRGSGLAPVLDLVRGRVDAVDPARGKHPAGQDIRHELLDPFVVAHARARLVKQRRSGCEAHAHE